MLKHQSIESREDNWIGHPNTVRIRTLDSSISFLPCDGCKYGVKNKVGNLLGVDINHNGQVVPLCSVGIPDRRRKIDLTDDEQGHNLRFANPYMMISLPDGMYSCPSAKEGSPKLIPLVWRDYTGQGDQKKSFDSRNKEGEIGNNSEFSDR